MRILVADDDELGRLRLDGLLRRWGYDPVMVADGDEAWAVLQREDTPGMALIDWMMPGMDGVDLCRRLRATELGAYVYVLLLTANDRQADVIAGLDAGADDYVVKPFAPQELKLRLGAGRRIVQLQQALRDQATHDALTRTWNRSGILAFLERELARSRRTGAPLVVAMVDVDHFKRVNDTFGHAAGDAVLTEVATRLAASGRPYDGVGRYGGEEFLVVLPDTREADAASVGERLRARLADAPIRAGAASVAITASFGVAFGLPGQAIDDLLREADAALYRAKLGGRNRVVIAEAGARHEAATGT